MEAVRKTVRSDMLSSIIDLPWASNFLEVELIVIPKVKEKPRQQEITVESLKGCLKAYANPSLWEKEQYA